MANSEFGEGSMKYKCAVRHLGATLLCLLISLRPTWGQTTSPKTPADVISNYSADLSIPDSPAAAALGIKASAIVMPHNPRELAASISSVSGARTGQGAALDFSPMLLFAGRSYSIKDYIESYGLRALIRTTIGIAGAKKTIAGSDYSGSGASLSTVLFDAGDTALDKDLADCVNAAQKPVLDQKIEFQKSSTNAASGDVDVNLTDADTLDNPQFAADVKKCFSVSDSKNWNRSKLAIGFWTTRFDPVTPGLPKGTGGNTGWITLQYGFDGFKPLTAEQLNTASQSRNFWGRLENQGSLVLHYRGTHGASDDSQIPASGPFPEMNTQLLAGRFTYGSQSRSAFAEVSRARQDLQGTVSGKTGGAFGGSFKLTKDLWFNLAMGRRQDFSSNGTLVSASFKYGTSSEPLVPSR
jgi:hypothetical protein